MRNEDDEVKCLRLLEWVSNHGARIWYSHNRQRVHVSVRGSEGECARITVKADDIGRTPTNLVDAIRAAKLAFDVVQDVPF